ncbi:MAG: hypothetical protein CMG64_05640 [Candidatus Marinimicrobia bacterium]|nr:hypothetical protein [Candidatus Neomarinimicrobiota bacterium]
MIDFHNHVLPDVDDGPKSIEESIEMLKFASGQGIKKIVNTVHFQHPKMNDRNVEYDYLKQKINDLEKIIANESLDLEILLSAEVFYLPNLVDISDNPITTIGNKNYMLIEFLANIFPTGYEQEFFKLQQNEITPIVAHPERYKFVQNDISILNDWKNRGYVIQIDAGSILGFFGKNVKNFSLEMIENGYIHIIGSDAHNNKKRNFCLFDAYESLGEIFSFDLVDILKQNSEKILEGEKVYNINKFTQKSRFSYLKEKIFKICKF